MSEHSTTPCRMDFRSLSAESFTEQTGRLESLWETGCTILSPQHPLLEATLELRIYLPDGEWPLRIDRAEITDGQSDSLTIEFLSLPAREQERLMTYLATDHTLVHA